MHHKPDVAANFLLTAFVAFEPRISVAQEMRQYRQTEAGPGRRGLIFQITGAQHDGARAGKRLEPLLLRRVFHAGVVSDEGKGVRRRLLQISRCAIKAEAEITDPARDQSRLGRPRQAQRDIGFAAVERGAALFPDQLDQNAAA
jgi:hypothetical protein